MGVGVCVCVCLCIICSAWQHRIMSHLHGSTCAWNNITHASMLFVLVCGLTRGDKSWPYKHTNYNMMQLLNRYVLCDASPASWLRSCMILAFRVDPLILVCDMCSNPPRHLSLLPHRPPPQPAPPPSVSCTSPQRPSVTLSRSTRSIHSLNHNSS